MIYVAPTWANGHAFGAATWGVFTVNQFLRPFFKLARALHKRFPYRSDSAANEGGLMATTSCAETSFAPQAVRATLES